MSTVLNKVFTDKEQRNFHWVNPDEVTNEGGFITNIDGKVVAFMDGVKVRVPKVLYNEVGRPYYYISNLKELGKKMARKHGVWKCSKNQPIRVYKVITEAANILIQNQLENSEIIRTNGNEFLIYMVGYDEKQVVTYIRKLNKAFKDLSHGFGAAIGYSMIKDGIKTVDDAINEATLDMRSNKEEANN